MRSEFQRKRHASRKERKERKEKKEMMRVKKNSYREITGLNGTAKTKGEVSFTKIICHAQNIILNLCLSEVDQQSKPFVG